MPPQQDADPNPPWNWNSPANSRLQTVLPPADRRWFTSQPPGLVVSTTISQNRHKLIHDNPAINCNLFEAACHNNVQRLPLGSNCNYPQKPGNFIAEEQPGTGPLEFSAIPLATARITPITLCKAYNLSHGCDFHVLMSCNLYAKTPLQDGLRQAIEDYRQNPQTGLG